MALTNWSTHTNGRGDNASNSQRERSLKVLNFKNSESFKRLERSIRWDS